MNNLLIGQYILFLRKQKQLSQKDLASQLNISFQAVSKWETGETLPDVSLLLELADILDTTVDRLLNGGNIVMKKSKKININDINEGFKSLESLKIYFGEDSTFYRGAIEGINAKMNIDIEEALRDDYTREVMIAEVIIQYIMKGYIVDENDINKHIQSEHMKTTIMRYTR